MTGRSFNVVILSMRSPREVARVALRIEKEVPEAKVCGILYERRPAKTFQQRASHWLHNLRDVSYLTYVAAKAWRSLFGVLATAGARLLQFAHACPSYLGDAKPFGLGDLARFCSDIGSSFLVTANLHSPEALEFVRTLRPDLGIVYGTRILKPELFDIPRQGSINIHKHKVPDYRGGGPAGLWELLDGQTEVGITVHRVTEKVDEGAVVQASVIPIDPFDNLTSLDLKADVVGNDLIVRAVAGFTRGTLQEKAQKGPGRTFRNPTPQHLRSYRKQIATRRPAYRPFRGRPMWKLIARAILLFPFVVVRNWARRFRRRFPVIVLYHHLVTDRPHRLGISTERFLKQVEFLRRHYRVVSLSESIELLRSGHVDLPTVVLTFDDGYRDNFTNLRAVTQVADIPVTLLVCTFNVGARKEFEHDLRLGYSGFLPLTWEQVTRLSETGVEVGSHTRSHFDCGSTVPGLLQGEIGGSKSDLEAHLGRPVRFFSFPWGHPQNMSPEALEIASVTYPHVLSACGGENFPAAGGEFWHLYRCGHSRNLLELELQLQGVLNLRTPAAPEWKHGRSPRRVSILGAIPGDPAESDC
jgi:peptidoglycan/xylan/chitin deacetylase (PgdA/CDA1 family)